MSDVPRVLTILGWLSQVAAWLVILAVTAILAIAVAVPRIAGATPYVILTGSMRPELPPGTLVVVKPVAPEKLGVGSVITYQLESGKPTVVTHRIVSAGVTAQGDRIFQTQGDANNTPDQAWVKPVQIRGERWYAVPGLGHITNFFTGQQRQVATTGIVVVLLGYASWMFGSAIGERRKNRRPTRRQREGVTTA